jgi:long-chain fatty acid transport protein
MAGMRRRHLAAAVLGILLLVRSARAGGFEYGSNGAEAVGRSGAFTARGDDPTALYYNVGTMGRMPDGTHLLLDVNLVHRSLSFTRFDDRDGDGTDDGILFHSSNHFGVNGQPFPTIEDSGGVFPAPFFGVMTDLGLASDFTFGFGVFGPAAVGRASFPTQVSMTDNAGNPVLVPSPQRYELLYMDILFIWPTLAASYRITDDLIVGVGFQSGFVNIRYDVTAVAAVPGATGAVNAVNDIRSSIDVWDPFVPAGLFGIWYRPIPYLELGLSTRLSDSIDASGDMVTLANPNAIGGDPVPSDTWTRYTEGSPPPSAELKFGWPTLVLRTGIRFVWPRDIGPIVGDVLDDSIESRLAQMAPARREWFDIELDLNYEMNSSVSDFITKTRGVVPIDDMTGVAIRPSSDPDVAGILNVPHNWVDVLSLRLGGDVNLLDGDLSLHWGFMFETSSVPSAYTRLDYAHWETYGVSCGVTARLPWQGIELTASYQRLFMPDRTVTDGSARVLTAISAPDDQIPVINNGTFRSSLDIFSLGATVSF